MRIMPTDRLSIKAIALAVVLSAGGTVCAQDEPWYSGISSRIWGLSDSIGFRGSLSGEFTPGGIGTESAAVQKQFGGYRLSDSIATGGAQTSFGLDGSACDRESSLGGDAYHSCHGSAWSLAGIATLPFDSGLSIYGRLGFHYLQKNGLEESAAPRRGYDDFGRVLGIGVSYELSKAVIFHAESEYYNDLPGSNGNGPASALGLDASVHSIGLSIKF